MDGLIQHPVLLFLVMLVLLSMSTWVGVRLLTSLQAQIAEMREDIRAIEGVTLTLLALLIGFTFSMAVGRYDQRKNLEEAEANAIGTEFVRADLLPAAEAARVKAMLVKYTELRIRFYTTHDETELERIDADTARAQGELWRTVLGPASAQPNPLMALVLAGMNDVLNSQGYTHAAWLNRIPLTAWVLMILIAIGATMLVGAAATSAKALPRVLFVLPLVLSVAFFLIADIDSPRRGLIAVTPQNLLILAESLRAAP